MINKHHKELLAIIKQRAGKGNTHTATDSYLGNSNPRYEITAPVLRDIGKEWMREHKDLSPVAFSGLLTSLMHGVSSTEKSFAGILLGYSTKAQREFPPKLFDGWLDHLQGWAEIDAVCTGDYTISHVPARWKEWKPLLIRFSKSKNVSKRRASLVVFTSLVRYTDDEEIARVAFSNIERLKHEKDVLITRAISWLLRSLIKNYRKQVKEYLHEYADSLPRIAVRETLVKLRTGKKTNPNRKPNPKPNPKPKSVIRKRRF
jgi:3-methyladenine DNA glycosylase AlkD